MVRRLLAVLALWPATALAQNPPLSTAANQTLRRMFTQVGSFGPPGYAAAPFACTAQTRRTTYYKTVGDVIEFCNGTAWTALGGITSPVAGDFVATGKWTWGTAADAASSLRLGETAGCVVMEGATADAFEARFCATDPTVGIATFNLPNAAGAVTRTLAVLEQAQTFSAVQTNTSSWIGPSAANFTTTAYGFGSFTNHGLGFNTSNQNSYFLTSGIAIAEIGGNAGAEGVNVYGTTFGFNFSASPGSGTDVKIRREAAAILQLGLDINGAAVAQTIKAHDGITGTDIAGANFTLAGGRGTGAGTASDLVLQTGTALATGTTGQTLVARHHIEGDLRALTDATATTVFTVTTGNDLSCGGTVFFTVEAADAANQQTTSGSANFAAADNAAGVGGEACTAAVTGTNASAATSGTLTVTADATTGTDVCNIRLTATGSLTETVGPRVRYSVVFNPTSSSCALTPQ